MADFGRRVRKILNDNGCSFHRRGRGDHDIWKSPLTEIPITVPDKIDSKHTANGILKDAGLPKAF
jgi:predicted RNA binding protein YcfA (HicA-like mRNA interferase family)